MVMSPKGSSWNNENAIDLVDHVRNISSASAEINIAAALAVASGKALVASDASITYILTAGVPIDLEKLDFIYIRAKIDTTNLDDVITDGCILTGALAKQTGGEWYFNAIISDNPSGIDVATTFPQIRISGTKSIKMYFQRVDYMQFFQVDEITEPDENRIANAYNAIYLNDRIARFEVTGTQRAVKAVWFNENTIYNGRFSKLIFVDKGYGHNHNYFTRPVFEGPNVEIDLQVGHNTVITGVRFENVSASQGVKFSAKTTNNIIERSWISGNTSRETVQDPLINLVTDLGLNNSVRRIWQTTYHNHTVLNFGPSLIIVSDGTGVGDFSSCTRRGVLDNDAYQQSFSNARPVIPGLQAMTVPSSFVRLAESNFIPVSKGAVFSLEVNIDQGFWRYQVQIFDSNMIPLDDSTALSSPFASYSSNGIYSSNDTLTMSQVPFVFDVEKDTVAYLKITFGTGSAANNIIRQMTCIYHEPPEGVRTTVTGVFPEPKGLWLKGVPIIGYAPLGQAVRTESGVFENTFELSTTTTAEIANSATSVTVNEITNTQPTGNIANGDICGIALDDGTTHWSAISGLAGSTFTITALVSPAGTAGAKALAGAHVMFNRWALEA